MQVKKWVLGAFVVVCLVQLGVPASMIISRENILKEGKEFKFVTEPVDPTDPFRGKYITLNYRDVVFETDTSLEWARGETTYVRLREDEEGFARIAGLSKSAPAGDVPFLKATIRYTNLTGKNTQLITVAYPFDRLYMEETLAPAAELAYAEAARDTVSTTWALVRVKNGDAVLEDVLIDGVSIREIAQQPTK